MSNLHDNVYEKKAAQILDQKQTMTLYTVPQFVYTLWLFTRSDHKTFVLPQTAFGIIGALSGPLLTSNAEPDFFQIAKIIPKVLLWTWLNTLIFTLSNQRRPESVAEDSLNKPFRPLPAGRITEEQTRRLLLLAIPVVGLWIYFYVGAFEETVVLFILTWMYNDLGGSDEDFVTRNLIISVAYGFYASGALRVACGTCLATWPPSNGLPWPCITSGIILTTMQIQDLKDQAGDRLRNRKTAPIVLGESIARWSIAIPVLAWSVISPIYWQLPVQNFGFVMTIAGAIAVAFRVIRLRSVTADRQTWKLWAYWLLILYCLPLFKNPAVFPNAFYSLRAAMS